MFVKDLGDILHLIGGTVAALLIFFNPGFMLINAAIVKRSANELDMMQEGEVSGRAGGEAAMLSSLSTGCLSSIIISLNVLSSRERRLRLHSISSGPAAGLVRPSAPASGRVIQGHQEDGTDVPAGEVVDGRPPPRDAVHSHFCDYNCNYVCSALTRIYPQWMMF